MVLRLFFTIFVTSCFCVNGYTLSKLKFVKIRITLKQDQSLAKLYSNFVKDDLITKKSSPMIQKTFKANPKIKNWRKLKKGTKITLYLNKAFLDPVKMKKYRKSPPKKKLKKKVVIREKKLDRKHFNLIVSGGMVGITDEDDNTLDINFVKLGVNYSNKFKKKYNYHIGISTLKFFNLRYSESVQAVSYDGFLPEFNLGLSRSFSRKITLGIGYDYLNYFVLNDFSSTKFTLKPKDIHRLNIKPFYALNSVFGVTSSLGLLNGAGTGIDGSLGLTATIGVKNKFGGSVSLIGYFSSLKVEGRKESSNVIVFSFGFVI